MTKETSALNLAYRRLRRILDKKDMGRRVMGSRMSELKPWMVDLMCRYPGLDLHAKAGKEPCWFMDSPDVVPEEVYLITQGMMFLDCHPKSEGYGHDVAKKIRERHNKRG